MYKKTELIYKEDARRIIDSPRSKQQMLNMLDSIPPIDDMLKQIRNEIEQVEINGYIRDVECYRAGLNTAVKIINKYKKKE